MKQFSSHIWSAPLNCRCDSREEIIKLPFNAHSLVYVCTHHTHKVLCAMCVAIHCMRKPYW